MGRAILAGFMFLLLILSFILGIVTPLDRGLAEDLALSVKNFVEENIAPRKNVVDLGIFIFSHNAIRALPMLIPLVGAIWGPIVIYITGIYTNAMMITSGILGMEKLKIAISTLIIPSSLLEMISYSLLSSESIALFRYLRGKKDYYLSYTIAIAIVGISILLLAGMVEALEIRRALSTLPTTYFP